MLTPTEKIWHNGRLIAWDDAKIHVLSHVVSYGSSVFEGIRCYETSSGPAAFRLREHLRRMVDSGKIYRMEIPFTLDQLAEAFDSDFPSLKSLLNGHEDSLAEIFSPAAASRP